MHLLLHCAERYSRDLFPCEITLLQARASGDDTGMELLERSRGLLCYFLFPRDVFNDQERIMLIEDDQMPVLCLKHKPSSTTSSD